VPRTIQATCGYVGLKRIESVSSKDVVCLRDNLSDGPLQELTDIESWRAGRVAFWDQVAGPPANSKARRRRAKARSHLSVVPDPERFIDAEEITLWLGTGLSDQLMLAWMPQFLRVLGACAEKLHVVQFERTRSGEPILELATLHESELQNCPKAEPLNDAELDYLGRAWNAVTSPDPGPLLGMMGEKRVPLPHLRTALRLMLRRYPDFRSGVNRHDALLLAVTRDFGPTAAWVIAHSMMASEKNGDQVGDLLLWWRLRRLAGPALRHPAVTLSGVKT
jgi:hypothetical protein